MSDLKQWCGVCGKGFSDKAEYINHVCEVTGYTPADPEHLVKSTTPHFANVSAKAIERGEAKK